MNQHKNAAKEYLQRQVQNSSASERVVLAYDGAIRFLMNARRAVEEKNIEARFINNKKGADIISYLMDTLDMEKGGEIAENLRRIYFYMLRRLVEVDVKNDVEPLDDVIGQLRQLRASWEKLSRGETEEDSGAAPEGKGSDAEASAPKKVSATA